MGNKKIGNNDFDTIEKYCVSEQYSSIVYTMSEDLKHMKRIICAKPDQLSILSLDNDIIDYTYAYEALWYNGVPLIRGVKSFYFEYRDDYGNLLAHFNHNYKSIETIGYIIRKIDKKREIIHKNMIKLSYNMLSYSIN